MKAWCFDQRCGHAVDLRPRLPVGLRLSRCRISGDGYTRRQCRDYGARRFSRLLTDAFYFLGFFTAGNGGASKKLIAWRCVTYSRHHLVFYEAPQRLAVALVDLAKAGWGDDRPAAVARELTKMFEETRRGTLCELAEYYRDNDVKGEIVVVVGPPTKTSAAANAPRYRCVAEAGFRKTESVRDAAAAVSEVTGARAKKRCLCAGVEAEGHQTVKKTTYRTGLAAEALCRLALRMKGYRIARLALSFTVG